MDPNAVLWDILVTAQRIGQLDTLEGHLDNLDKIRDLALALAYWIQSGGFAPNLLVWVLKDEEISME